MRARLHIIIFFTSVFFLLISCVSNEVKMVASETAANSQKSVPEVVDFNFHVKPILSDRCFACHGPDEKSREAGLGFHTEEMAFAALVDNPGHFAIVPGKPDESILVERIYSNDDDIKMPPPSSNLTLSDYEKEVLKKWIEQGAVWKKHWAFIPPEEPKIPDVQDRDWGKNPIDAFVLEKMQSIGLSPAERASPEKLIRRASFDITGLPPAQEDIEAFASNPSDEAFEQYLDKLLSTTAYAERMASKWLDIGRYADTNGYQDDFERFNWPWRDWVIHAYQENMPYDQFVTWQLAGDLLENPSLEQLIATGFNRNHKITNEGGVIPEEYRVEYVSDRTNTFGTAFLGLTMECAKCHDHKYDPLSQRNYYELYSFFNNVDEDGYVPKDVDPKPIIKLTHQQVDRVLDFINMPDSIKEVKYMVMKEMPKPRPAFVLRRGGYDKYGEPVSPSTPEYVLPYTSEFAKNRKGLSEWLFDKRNPLTARVAVNRLWQQIFGKGIVATPDDFGNQGSLPTHPELLDHLALKYQNEGWNTKDIIKYMMTSATYQQSAATTDRKNEIDPENMYLSHAPRLRLPAEMIRDHALAISGLLVDEVGGPSVKPYQPEGIWEETTGGGGGSTSRYVEDTGNGLYRKSLYTFWKRTVPPPSMMTFDAASRDLCIVEREQTSTPLQALVLLNDPQYVEACRVMATNLMNEYSAEKASEIISEMFLRATSRKPTEGELDEIMQFYKVEKSRFEKDPKMAEEFILIGHKPPPNQDDKTTLAAYSSVALMIFNLDETINKG